MNMGGPADHWITDIFSWKRPAFGEPIDGLIREIHRFGGYALLRDDQPLARRLSDLWPQWGRVDEEALTRLAADLIDVRNDLRQKAEPAGWEIDPS